VIYALDSNIISYLFKGDPVVYDNNDLAMADGGLCVIPRVVYYGIRRGPILSGATKKAVPFDSIYRKHGVEGMPTSVWNEAAMQHADLSKQGRLVVDADLLIGAFCVVNGYTLVTNNQKHFENISDIQLVNRIERPCGK